MKLTIGELSAYAYCPWLQSDTDCERSEQQYSTPVAEALTTVLRHAFVREMESGRKPGWQVWTNKWIRTFWREKDLNDKHSTHVSELALLLLKDLYLWFEELEGTTILVNFPFELPVNGGKDRLLSTLPIVRGATDSGPVEIIFFDVPGHHEHFRRDLFVRAAALAISQTLPNPIECLRGLHFDTQKGKWKELAIYPTEEFHENTRTMIDGLAGSIREDFRYPNHTGCMKCTLKTKCKR